MEASRIRVREIEWHVSVSIINGIALLSFQELFHVMFHDWALSMGSILGSSRFSLDAISCGVRVFNDLNTFREQRYFNKKYFIKIDLDNTKLSFLKIKFYLDNYYKLPKNKFNINKFKKKYLKYFTKQIVNK